jgi:hypothetical protein
VRLPTGLNLELPDDQVRLVLKDVDRVHQRAGGT